MGDCFTVLIQTHMFYFARWAHIVNIVPFFPLRVGRGSFVAVSCFQLVINFAPLFSSVCHSSTYLWMQPWFIVSIG